MTFDVIEQSCPYSIYHVTRVSDVRRRVLTGMLIREGIFDDRGVT
jgi:hypothetical protein